MNYLINKLDVCLKLESIFNFQYFKAVYSKSKSIVWKINNPALPIK